MTSVKCVVVGSGHSAKTELLHTHISQQTTSPHCVESTLPVSDTYCTTSANSSITMGLFNTAGQEDYDRLRPLSYPQTDVFLLCFSVMSPSSFTEIREKFGPEIRNHCPDVPIILVGTESHKKRDPEKVKDLLMSGGSPIERAMVNELVTELNAVKYIECSSLTKKRVSLVFEEAAIAALGYLDSAEETKQCKII